MKLTIFYDSACPLCNAEMMHLKKHDREDVINLQDLHAEGFSQRYPHIDPLAADRVLHAELENGDVIKGLDVTAKAWSLVGKYKWIAILRWPVIRIVSDACYRFFARYRNSISALFSPRRQCNSCHPDDHKDSK